MKKFILTLMLAVLATGFSAALADYSFAASDREEVAERLELNNVTVDQLVGTGAVSKEIAEKIVDLREQLGSFQSYDDLEELNIPKEQLEKLQFNTTIQGIAADCNC